MAVEARRLEAVESVFGIQATSHLLSEVVAPWVRDLGVLVELIEFGRPAERRRIGSPARCCGCRFPPSCAATAAWSARRR